MLTFDALTEGATFGPIDLGIPEGEFEGLYGKLNPAASSSAGLPSGLLMALAMRGYLEALSERPRGNVHAGQKVTWLSSVGRGLPLAVRVRCAAKELRKGRRWVTFDAVLEAGGTPHLLISNTMIWAQ